jgi:DNA-binding CsgD family transcriptional regulator
VDFRRKIEDDAAKSAIDRVTVRVLGDIDYAAAELQREVRASGLHIMAWHDLGTSNQMLDAKGAPLNCTAFGWSEDNIREMQEANKASRSPLLRACRVESEAFWVNRQAIRTRWKNEQLVGLDLEDFERRSHAKAAIVVPVHLPVGRIGAAVLTSEDRDKTDLHAEFLASTDTLCGLIRRFIDGYVRVTQKVRHLAIEGCLTTRQIQCLHWAAQGKTDWEIGTILGCSHAAVRYHMVRASEALDATNRAQTIYNATLLGYLAFSN